MQEQLSKPDTVDKKIDESQIKLRSLEQQTDVEGLSKKLKEYDHAFFDQVNVYQDLDQTFNMSSKEALKHFGKGKKDIDLYLRTIAATGKAWLEVKKHSSENQKDISKKPSAEDISAMAEVIDAQAKDLQKSLKEYRENMVAIGKMEEIKIIADDNFGRVLETEKTFGIASADPDTLLKACNQALIGQDGSTGYVGLKSMLQAHTELPEAYRAEIGNLLEKRLPALAEKKSRAVQLKLIHDKYADAVALGFKNGKWELFFTEKGQSLDSSEKQKILTEMAAISLNIEENLEVATAPEFMQKFWIGKALFESGDLINAQKLLLVFSKTDSIKMDTNQRFAFKKADYLAKTSEMLKAIDDQLGKHKEFYEAQNLLQTGDVADAKKLLKKYNYIGPATSVEEEGYRKSAKALLQKIALAQLQSVEEKFNAIKPLSGPQLAEHKYGSGPGSRKEYADTLQRIRASITTGKYVDFVDAYKAEFSKLTYPGDRYFNCLEDILEEEKGKSGLLVIARKYRELGRRDLAEDYFRRYFGEKLNTTLQKSDQIPALGMFEKQMKASYKFIAREGNEWEKSKHQLGEQYDKKAASNPEWATQNPLDQYLKKARAANAKQLIDGAYQDLVIREQNHQFIARGNFGNPEEKAAWGEYMNMKGYHGEEKWWSPVALSDEMAEELTRNLIIDIAITAASAGLGGAAAGVVKEAITAARFGKLAIAMGKGSALAEVAGFGTESAVFFLGDKTLRNVIHKEEFKFSMQDFLVSTLHLGGFQALGKTTHALGLGNASKALQKTTALSSQLVFQGAASGGELSLKDLAFIAGLEIVHGRGKGEKKTTVEKSLGGVQLSETKPSGVIKIKTVAVKSSTAETGKWSPKVLTLRQENIKRALSIGAAVHGLAGEPMLQQIEAIATVREGTKGDVAAQVKEYIKQYPTNERDAYVIRVELPDGRMLAHNHRGEITVYSSREIYELAKEKLSPRRLGHEEIAADTVAEKMDILIKLAKEAMPMFDAMTLAVGQKIGALEIHNASVGGPKGEGVALKDKEQGISKIRNFDGTSPERKLTDVLRGTIVCNDIPTMSQAIIEIMRDPNVLKVSVQNRIVQDGCNDILLNIKLKNGHVAELQLHVPEIKKAVGEGYMVPESFLSRHEYVFSAEETLIVEALKIDEPGKRTLRGNIKLPQFGKPLSVHVVYEIMRSMPVQDKKTPLQQALYSRLNNMMLKTNDYAMYLYMQRTGLDFKHDFNL